MKIKRGILVFFIVLTIILIFIFLKVNLSGNVIYYEDNHNLATLINFIWPAQNYSDLNYGAESNPTGEPIGGFFGYSRIVDSDYADYYVSNVSELLFALSNVSSGQIIYLNDSSVFDLSEYREISIPGNITLASGRGKDYSFGALIKVDMPNSFGNGSPLFIIQGDNVRITGLRFGGGDENCNIEYHTAVYSVRADLSNRYYQIKPTHEGISINASNIEIDNSEFFGWRHAAISGDGLSNNTYIHHNYIHHNCHNGLGYGISLGYDVQNNFLIEGNLFDHNRHSIASTYETNSYEARYNINLDEKISHDFDRHGNFTIGGLYTLIHHNTNYMLEGNCTQPAVKIRSPPAIEDGAQIYNNWFQCNNLSTAVITLDSSGNATEWAINTSIFNNYVNSTPLTLINFPVPVLKVDKEIVDVGEEISFDSSSSYNIGENILYVKWEFGDASDVSYLSKPKHSFNSSGNYVVTLTAYNKKGLFREVNQTIFVRPQSNNSYLSFWIYEDNEVNTSGIVKKQALINNQIVWEEDIFDGVHPWRKIIIDLNDSFFEKDVIKLQLIVKAVETYPYVNYPSTHNISFFQVYFDSINLVENVSGEEFFYIIDENNFETGVNRFEWFRGISYDERISGKYSYRIAPRYRDFFNIGNYAGIEKNFLRENKRENSIIMYPEKSFSNDSQWNKFNFFGDMKINQDFVLIEGNYFKFLNGNNNYFKKEGTFNFGKYFKTKLILFERGKINPLISLENKENKLNVYFDLENKLVIEERVNNNIVYKATSKESFDSYRVYDLSFIQGENWIVSNTNENLELIHTGKYMSVFPSYSSFFIGKSDENYFHGFTGDFYFTNNYSEFIKNKTIKKLNFNNSTNQINYTIVGNVSLRENSFGKKILVFEDNSSKIVVKEFNQTDLAEYSLEIKANFSSFKKQDFILTNGVYSLLYATFDTSRISLANSIVENMPLGDSSWNRSLVIFSRNVVNGQNVPIANNEFFTLTYTKKGNFLKSYVDGKLFREIYIPEEYTISDSALADLEIRNFAGELEYFSFYDYELSPMEVYRASLSIEENCIDSDFDGYGSLFSFGFEKGCLYDLPDCNDANYEINPGQLEIFENFVDENCDGIIGQKSSVQGTTGIYTKKSESLENDSNFTPKNNVSEGFNETIDEKKEKIERSVNIITYVLIAIAIFILYFLIKFVYVRKNK